ncbi:MAG: PhoU domain-containing protein [Promethearchaeota archaeon]
MRLGMSSLVVSVPKEWAEKYALSKDSRLVLIPQPDGSLALYPETISRESPRQITLTVKSGDIEGLLEQRMVAAYLTDFDEIRIQSTEVMTPELSQRIRQALRFLTGYQIMEADAVQLLIQNVARVADMDVMKALHRIHSISHSMLKDAIVALSKRDAALAKTVMSLEEDVVQFYYLVNKQLRSNLLDPQAMQQSGLTAIDSINYSLFLHAVQRIAMAAKIIAKAAITLNEKECPEEILDVVRDSGEIVLSLFDKASTAFLTRNDIAACEVMARSEDYTPLQETVDNILDQHLSKVYSEIGGTSSAKSRERLDDFHAALRVVEQVFHSLHLVACAASRISEVAVWRAMEVHRPPAKPRRKRRKRSKSEETDGGPSAS